MILKFFGGVYSIILTKTLFGELYSIIFYYIVWGTILSFYLEKKQTTIKGFDYTLLKGSWPICGLSFCCSNYAHRPWPIISLWRI